ncbi:hypothetical protein [Sphingomonas sp. BK345]|uniref:hypothetical protein n=1 Tax=Sphingomonas sp. BK345 TaxID=2586980 RepID=UPI00181CB7C8|nr:hypothetical protein [Sphingomonas sp. BK345]MBB3472607.1 hypothetical protein [Sphingomonas sp. BK345]
MFEFDAAKSAANRLKLGIDFPTARALWHDPLALRIPVRRSASSSRAGWSSAISTDGCGDRARRPDPNQLGAPRATGGSESL